jgi:hypothetical protein
LQFCCFIKFRYAFLTSEICVAKLFVWVCVCDLSFDFLWMHVRPAFVCLTHITYFEFYLYLSIASFSFHIYLFSFSHFPIVCLFWCVCSTG